MIRYENHEETNDGTQNKINGKEIGKHNETNSNTYSATNNETDDSTYDATHGATYDGFNDGQIMEETIEQMISQRTSTNLILTDRYAFCTMNSISYISKFNSQIFLSFLINFDALSQTNPFVVILMLLFRKRLLKCHRLLNI